MARQHVVSRQADYINKLVQHLKKEHKYTLKQIGQIIGVSPTQVAYRINRQNYIDKLQAIRPDRVRQQPSKFEEVYGEGSSENREKAILDGILKKTPHFFQRSPNFTMVNKLANRVQTAYKRFDDTQDLKPSTKNFIAWVTEYYETKTKEELKETTNRQSFF